MITERTKKEEIKEFIEENFDLLKRKAVWYSERVSKEWMKKNPGVSPFGKVLGEKTIVIDNNKFIVYYLIGDDFEHDSGINVALRIPIDIRGEYGELICGFLNYIIRDKTDIIRVSNTAMREWNKSLPELLLDISKIENITYEGPIKSKSGFVMFNEDPYIPDLKHYYTTTIE